MAKEGTNAAVLAIARICVLNLTPRIPLVRDFHPFSSNLISHIHRIVHWSNVHTIMILLVDGKRVILAELRIRNGKGALELLSMFDRCGSFNFLENSSDEQEFYVRNELGEFAI